MLKIKNLKADIDSKSILNNFNLEIKPGEVHAIMGPNGSGKSTFCLLYTSPSPRDRVLSRMPSSA